MQETLTVLMAQINPKVGAIEANAKKIMHMIQEQQNHHDVIVFPELALCGYPPEDLLFQDDFNARIEDALTHIKKITQNTTVILGHPRQKQRKRYNSASIFQNSQCIVTYDKQHLPNDGVFDERRYFTPGIEKPCIVSIKNIPCGIVICEDIWQTGPIEQLKQANAHVVFILNASPFDINKPKRREALLKHHARSGMHLIYVNQVGGQDELIFDGQSMAFNNKGQLCARSTAFQEDLQQIILDAQNIKGIITQTKADDALLYDALVFGLKEYVTKNNIPGVLLGLSGGIDSALTLAIAVDALGANRVRTLMLPSCHTADISLIDAQQQADDLGVDHRVIPIQALFEAMLHTLNPHFIGSEKGVTEENLQARIRGTLLMGLSNQLGFMLLNTSNKSETAVGYSTLYGDMCGGFAPIKDVLKTEVYRLARFRNHIKPVIPERVLTRPPSAELAPNQVDQDTLPDYPTLDAIITLYMEQHWGVEQMVAEGFDAFVVTKVLKLIKANEYKRRQSAPGPKISPCAFGRDYRYPITYDG